MYIVYHIYSTLYIIFFYASSILFDSCSRYPQLCKDGNGHWPLRRLSL